jgi:hypothetical protein
VAYTTGYAASGTLSEDIGDYSLIPSGQYLAADEDRLLIGGIFGETEAETEQLASRVMWTPVFGDPGVGNDERIPIDTDNFLDLDGFEGGPLTGLSTAANGYIYAFKRSHIYKLVRTGQRTKAYEAFPITKTRGAIPGSIVDGVDEAGRPAIFFLDPRVGPCMIGPNGLQTCGADILETFQTINQNASVVSVSLFYPEARQVHWWIATDDSDTPNLRLVLQTNEMRLTNEGYRRGWTVWDGPSAETVSACLYAENVDDTGDPRSLNLVPFIAKLDDDGLIQRTDTGDDDNGTEYEAHIRTKPYLPEGTLNRCGIMSGALIAKAQAGASLDVIVTRDFGLEQVSVSVPLDPASSETHVIKTLDNLSLSEARAVQIEFIDPATPGARWELTQLALRERREQSA